MEKVAGDEHNLRYLYQMMKPHYNFDAPFVRRYWGMQYRSQKQLNLWARELVLQKKVEARQPHNLRIIIKFIKNWK